MLELLKHFIVGAGGSEQRTNGIDAIELGHEPTYDEYSLPSIANHVKNVLSVMVEGINYVDTCETARTTLLVHYLRRIQ